MNPNFTSLLRNSVSDMMRRRGRSHQVAATNVLGCSFLDINDSAGAVHVGKEVVNAHVAEFLEITWAFTRKLVLIAGTGSMVYLSLQW
jgi:hypothetical protein